MRLSIFNVSARSLGIVALFLMVVALPVGSHAYAAGPFAKLHGTWSGGGVVRLDTGASEKIRCRAYYTAKSRGAKLGMAIRCASAGNKFELRARLKNSGGSVSGTWEERTFNAGGGVSGRATAKSIKLRINGSLKGNVSISTKGKKQWVSITTAGPGLKSVTISLRRR